MGPFPAENGRIMVASQYLPRKTYKISRITVDRDKVAIIILDEHIYLKVPVDKLGDLLQFCWADLPIAPGYLDDIGAIPVLGTFT